MPLARAVWVMKLTVTDLPVAVGTRSAAATVKVTPETTPPICGVLAPPIMSAVVWTPKLNEAQAEPPVPAACGAGMVAPVRVIV